MDLFYSMVIISQTLGILSAVVREKGRWVGYVSIERVTSVIYFVKLYICLRYE